MRMSAGRARATTLLAFLLSLGAPKVACAGEWDEDADGVARETPARTVGKVDGGATYRRIFGLGVVGAEGGIAIGFRPKGGRSAAPEILFRARYAFGRTEHALAVHLVRTGAELEFPLGRFRPFVGAGFSWLAFDRVTEHGLVQHWGVGLSAGIHLDVIRTTERSAIYLGFRVDADAFPHKLVPRTGSGVGALVAGYRF